MPKKIIHDPDLVGIQITDKSIARRIGEARAASLGGIWAKERKAQKAAKDPWFGSFRPGKEFYGVNEAAYLAHYAAEIANAKFLWIVDIHPQFKDTCTTLLLYGPAATRPFDAKPDHSSHALYELLSVTVPLPPKLADEIRPLLAAAGKNRPGPHYKTIIEADGTYRIIKLPTVKNKKTSRK